MHCHRQGLLDDLIGIWRLTHARIPSGLGIPGGAVLDSGILTLRGSQGRRADAVCEIATTYHLQFLRSGRCVLQQDTVLFSPGTGQLLKVDAAPEVFKPGEGCGSVHAARPSRSVANWGSFNRR
jgi:hypothetical protein